MGLLFLTFVAVVVAFAPEPKPHVHHGWQRGQRTNSQKTISFHIALKRDFEHVTRELYDIADPASKRYGQWYQSVEQLNKLITPKANTVVKVLDWLSKNGIDNCHLMATPDWMECLGVTVVQAERLLHCQLFDYTHPELPNVVISRALSYSVPNDLADSVDFISNIKRLPNLRSLRGIQATKQAEKRQKARQSSMVTPQRMRQLWSVNVQGSTTNGNIQEVAQFLGQFIQPSDLENFWSTFNITPVGYYINGPNQLGNPGVEAMLDIEYITGVNQGTMTWGTITPGLRQGQEPFLVWLLAIANATGAQPIVHSVSYADTEDSLDLPFMTRVDQEFQKLGLLGHTFIYASGDSGVDCMSSGTRQQPTFPSCSPHVISVGGQVDLGTPVPRSWSGSGGGFSNQFKQPSWMQSAHQGYLSNPSNNLPPSSLYNQTGRGYPDVSAIAMNVAIVVDGFLQPVGGTSCAAPVISSLLSLVNDARKAAGKNVIGFYLPTLYSNSVKSGYVPISTGPANSAGSCQGFQPDVNGGWSPIVGFGGINLSQFLKF